MRGEQAIFNLEIKKKSGSSINPDIHRSKVPSSGYATIFLFDTLFVKTFWKFKFFNIFL